jgi:predicted DNA-binding transcriptional regulator AlpA
VSVPAAATVAPVTPKLGGEEYWSRRQVADYLGIAPTTVSSWVSRRQPKADPIPEPTLIGRTPLWRAAEIRAWNERRLGKGWRGRQPG